LLLTSGATISAQPPARTGAVAVIRSFKGRAESAITPVSEDSMPDLVAAGAVAVAVDREVRVARLAESRPSPRPVKG